ncbi:MAG: mechanosensitive ion channel [Herminiimonas sp.]|nr:mechanosensitive ion channel [Herminiimonas sp.]MDB5853761.1 mechanosensitive ion channel [Herminiimonas sp.]
MIAPDMGWWPDLLAELRNPAALWQLGTIAICLLAGALLARVLRAWTNANETNLRVMRMGVKSFGRVLSPLLALVLMAVARPILAQWHHVNIVRLAIPLVASFALIRLVFYMLRRVFARHGNVGSFLLAFEKVFALLVWLGVALYITGVWPDVLAYLEQTAIPVGRYKTSLLTILQGLISVGATLVLALWAGALLEERLMQVDAIHSSLRTVLSRTVRASLILIAILVSLSLVGIDLTVLSVFGGALGVGLGLGLQKIVSSYVSGFVILLERSMAVGDMVAVDKYYGRVTQINTRYTVLRGLDGIETVIPNEMLVAGAVQNYSLSDRRIRVATQVTVGYETDIEALLPVLSETMLKMNRVLADPPPVATLTRFGADGLELEIGLWISDPENGRGNLLSDMNREIWRTLQERCISVPYPQRELRIANGRSLIGEPMPQTGT